MGYNYRMIGRFAAKRVTDALDDTPVVLIQGPRQSGKSTLAKQIAEERFGGNTITLDDPIALSDAKSNPRSFLQSRPTPIVIDEVQRAPELFLSLKLLVDKDRKPGQYLLTGSSNVLLLPKVADSLAGRMEPIDLMPLCQAEVQCTTENFIDKILQQNGTDQWRSRRHRLQVSWSEADFRSRSSERVVTAERPGSRHTSERSSIATFGTLPTSAGSRSCPACFRSLPQGRGRHSTSRAWRWKPAFRTPP